MYNIISVCKDKSLREYFIKYCLKNRIVHNISSAKNILGKFIISNISTKPSDYILGPKIVQFLDDLYPTKTILYRADERCVMLRNILGELSFRPDSLVDIGCGDATITLSIANIFNIPYDSLFGIDIFPPVSTRIQTMHPDGIKDIPDKSINLVVAFMSLHHIHNVYIVLDQVSRILTPGGIFFVREHDCGRNNKTLKRFLYSIHSIINSSRSAHFPWDCGAYKSKINWISTIELCGFRFVHEYVYPEKNPQKIINLTFRKI